MSPAYAQSLFFFVLLPCMVALNVVSIMIYANKKPGTSLLTNPYSRPDCLTERGLWLRKWALGIGVAMAICLVFGTLVGIVFRL
jgi:hypothetical protein